MIAILRRPLEEEKSLDWIYIQGSKKQIVTVAFELVGAWSNKTSRPNLLKVHKGFIL